ncbi:MAG: group II intron reverse transcriptase/maturase [Gammaproteobacteria bacterium]|nr:group II intron reverse transcriptase/maturase [Gammaproteobacteria bacterium]
MTKMLTAFSGAPHYLAEEWKLIEWETLQLQVHRLQMRIAKAYREGRHNKVKALQWLLTHSFAAKLLAVKRVTSNQGAKTPGVDNVLWRTPQQKMQAALSLKRRGYQPQPLKRIYIPKKQKEKLRPLSIPPMQCRAQQALHLLALEPIAETIADKNAYGFRPYRSTTDATEQCFLALAHRGSAQYILEGDIKSCFDTISHQWLRQHVPMDKVMLNKWLNAGYIEKENWHPTEFGVPQGGIISPTLLVITLSGLEATVKSVVSQQRIDKIYMCSYADDFIITGATKEVLENKVMPVLEKFLLERGLVLSKEKTKITHIDEGFDFLGVNFRKYSGKLIRKPAKDNVHKFLENIRETIKSNATAKAENLIHQLNPKIRGWANYHRHICAKQTFNKVRDHLFHALWRWAKRRHTRKSRKWIAAKYFRTKQCQHWVFYDKVKDEKGKTIFLDLIEISRTPIRRHIKFKAEANPYDPAYQDYIAERLERRKKKQLFRMERSYWSPWWEINNLETASL